MVSSYLIILGPLRYYFFELEFVTHIVLAPAFGIKGIMLAKLDGELAMKTVIEMEVGPIPGY